MSRSTSRGPLQTVARAGSFMPGHTLRSATGLVERARTRAAIDPTSQTPEKQFTALSRSCHKIARSLKNKIRTGKDWERTATTLANQRARLDMVADRLVLAHEAEPVHIRTKPVGQRVPLADLPPVRVLPDLTVDLRGTAKTRKRFDRPFVNRGLVIRIPD